MPPADLALSSAAAPAASAAVVGASAPPLSWRDRLLDWRDRLLAHPAFHRWAAAIPFTRPIARNRAAALFDLCAGFAYTQTLQACVRVDLFRFLAAAPRTPAEIAAHAALPPEATARLLGAAEALGLVQRRSHGRVGLGALGAPIAGTPGLAEMIAHNALLYDDLRDPLAVLRGTHGDANLSHYYPYAAADAGARAAGSTPDRVAAYSQLMAATVLPLCDELLDAYDLGRHARLLDVGGGEGAFLERVAGRHPALALTLFDLPAVGARARQRFARAGIGERVQVVDGDFATDPLPEGADVVSLVRILLDHDDATVQALLRRVRAALPRRGVVLVAEAMAGLPGSATVGDVYFAWYLRAMGRGRARRTDEIAAHLRAAGFAAPRLLRTRYPLQASVLAARAV